MNESVYEMNDKRINQKLFLNTFAVFFCLTVIIGLVMIIVACGKTQIALSQGQTLSQAYLSLFGSLMCGDIIVSFAAYLSSFATYSKARFVLTKNDDGITLYKKNRYTEQTFVFMPENVGEIKQSYLPRLTGKRDITLIVKAYSENGEKKEGSVKLCIAPVCTADERKTILTKLNIV